MPSMKGRDQNKKTSPSTHFLDIETKSIHGGGRDKSRDNKEDGDNQGKHKRRKKEKYDSRKRSTWIYKEIIFESYLLKAYNVLSFIFIRLWLRNR